MTFSKIWKRITSETEIKKFNQLAELVGTTGQYVSRKKNKDEFPIEWAYSVAKKYGLLTEWIIEGKEPRRLDLKSSVADSQCAEFTMVPKYKARLSSGHGSFRTSDQIEANYAFRTEFIRSKGNPKDMALFEIMGDSMEPFIYDGDVVMVDMSKNELEDIVDGKAYAFREGETVKVKRLSRQANRLIASSENYQKYPPYQLENGDFGIIGKVIWLGHEVN
ncbi:LexA family transcriptional regulator [Desulfogranum japonicum]|uniref:LexA family transcriptional regulator n=1 Tax=Desulfogranum japonicum TaxID=231447 RepID=UPI000422E917|nr:LexA family transcriptional regulator [Desulfogranum japonicum]